MLGGDWKFSRCKQVEMCHDRNEETKGPYQADDNGDMKEKKNEGLQYIIGLN